MDWILHRLEPGDRPAAARLLDDAVGAGFWGFCEGGDDLSDFYAAGSVATGALCPYCGAPPCRCAARPYVKTLPPA